MRVLLLSHKSNDHNTPHIFNKASSRIYLIPPHRTIEQDSSITIIHILVTIKANSNNFKHHIHISISPIYKSQVFSRIMAFLIRAYMCLIVENCQLFCLKIRYRETHASVLVCCLLGGDCVVGGCNHAQELQEV